MAIRRDKPTYQYTILPDDVKKKYFLLIMLV